MTDEAPTVDALQERLDDLDGRLDAAETEADLDEIEADLDALEADIEDADLPEPEDEDETPPEDELTDALSDLTDTLEEQRGPYAEDVADEITTAASTIENGDWTDDGAAEAHAAVEAFRAAASDHLEGLPTLNDADERDELVEAGSETLEATVSVVEDAGLDPDDDAETIAALLDTTAALADDLDDAEEWGDLSVREQLAGRGFYDVLDHRKDFPPEWNAIKIYEKRGEPEKILLAYDLLDSEFMERHCLEALERMGPAEALDEMETLAQRRDEQAISVLGTIGSEAAVDTIIDYVDADSTPNLQKTTITALGEIGSEEAVQPIANQLVADNEDVRSVAARGLGLIGDTRAIEPLAEVLETDDSDRVRASAAWALLQIGTERALETASEYEDDRAYLVQAEAEKASAAF